MRRMDRTTSARRSTPATRSCSTAGLATQLEAQGDDLSDACGPPACWSRSPRRSSARTSRSIRAGARVATTASYQATFEGFAARGLDHEAAADLLRRSVELAERARSIALDEGVAGAAVRRRVDRPVRGDARGRLRVPRPVRPDRGASWPTSTASGSGSSRAPARTSSPSRRSRSSRRPGRRRAPGRASGHGGLDQLLVRRRWRTSGAASRIEEAVAAVDGRPGRRRDRRQLHAPEHVDELLARIRGRRRCRSSSTPTAARAGTPSPGAGRGPRPGAWTATPRAAGEPPGAGSSAAAVA